MAAKVRGTVNLHNALSHLPLDFFVMTTATGALWAPPTQAAYIAANSFQDAFARYRRCLERQPRHDRFEHLGDVHPCFRRYLNGVAGIKADDIFDLLLRTSLIYLDVSIEVDPLLTVNTSLQAPLEQCLPTLQEMLQLSSLPIKEKRIYITGMEHDLEECKKNVICLRYQLYS